MPDDRPNILLICTDQQHWQMMSYAGNTDLHTPAMDRLAAEGTRFDRAYCANPVCAPSRFTMFTGRMPSAIGMRTDGNKAPNNREPLPTHIERNGMGWLLQSAGYRCLYGGKQHIPRSSAEKLGFEVVSNDDRDELAETCAGIVSQPDGEPYCLVASFMNPHDICYMAIGDSLQTDGEHRTWENGKAARVDLAKALQRPAGVSDEAFFAEHCPPLPPNFEPQEDEPEAVTHLLERRAFRMRARQQWSDQRWREHRWAYARLTEFVDRQIGRVLEALDNSQQQRETVVVFLSDHGDMDASHRMEHKSAFYEEAARVPLIVRHPGHVPAGRVNTDDVVSTGLDVIPTLCDYAGIAPPDDFEGRSFRDVAEGRPAEPPRECVKLECNIGLAVVTSTHKYVRCDDGANAEQLYDLMNDPHEMRNALHDTSQQDALAACRRMFDEMFAEAAGEQTGRT